MVINLKNKKIFITHSDLILDKFYNGQYNVIKSEGGGCNWNVLYNLSNNLDQKCYGFGICGNDEDGTILLNGLNEVGINTKYIRKDNSISTNVMNIIIPSGKINDNDVIHTWYSPITNNRTINFSDKLPTIFPKELENNDIYVILDKFRNINMKFIDNIPNKKLCLDVGHVRYIRYFKKDYLLKFFRKANVITLNDTTSSLLYKKLGIKNELEFFNLLDLDLFVLTAGKNQTTFIIKENGKPIIIHKKPTPIEDVVDTTGAGDAFFSTIINEYAYSNKIDEAFIHSTFKKASNNALYVLMQIGARIDWKL